MAAMHVSPYGGSWYPGDRAELERLLEELCECSEQRTGPHLLANAAGFVTPHAGLAYSGTVAAAVYRHVRQQEPRRAVILGFAHRGGPRGISIPDIDGYQTPLGAVRVDRDAMGRLAEHAPFQAAPERSICDHSLEIQLPLLQWAAPHATVVPLFVGRMNAAARDRAADILASMWGGDSVFLASSDLTHYGQAFGFEPFPVDSKIAMRLERLDGSVIEAAASLDADLFAASVRESRATVCGVAPISLWLRTLAFVKGAEIFQETLDYQTSGEITGDYHHCVSYGALGYFPAASFRLEKEDQALLLESARATLDHLRATREAKAIPPREITPALWRKAGIFVSMRQGERLLGCVGNRTSGETLAENVPEMTLRAALDDPRFHTVLEVEGEIDIEISLLSPMKPIADARGFRVDEHGASLEAGGCQALLLPQVARGRGWNAEQFLSALSMKAGLGSKGYPNPGARLSVFRAQVFATPKAAGGNS